MPFCSKCGSDDIEIEVVFNLRTKTIVQMEDTQYGTVGDDCYCNKCGWSTIVDKPDPEEELTVGLDA